MICEGNVKETSPSLWNEHLCSPSTEEEENNVSENDHLCGVLTQAEKEYIEKK